MNEHLSYVIFPGFICGDVLEGAFCEADAFFFPSQEETEGIIVLESLASYQTVIVRDISVFANWMQDTMNCYKGICNDEFVKLIGNVVENRLPDVRDAACKTAQVRSIPVIAGQLRSIYESRMNDESTS